MTVSRRDPQKPGDDGQRKRQGAVCDEVEGSAGGRGRQQVVAGAFDLSAELPNSRRGVKAMLTSLRRRPWSGGSRPSMLSRSGLAKRGNHGNFARRSRDNCCP